MHVEGDQGADTAAGRLGGQFREGQDVFWVRVLRETGWGQG